ncbi:hypothetical protein [Novipirellula herctigrandis]
MKTRLLAGHPRTEQIRNQVAVKRGPVVYCLESNDVKGDVAFEPIAMDADAKFGPELSRSTFSLANASDFQRSSMRSLKN